uniref:G-protein coupled receptors family 1 profile domain-containing protein n=1 Tax=Romanomermis culicivorax TaxID=13658 RepID=A0A915I9Q1_ROMCU
MPHEKIIPFNDTDSYFLDQGLNLSTFASDVKHSPNNNLSLIVYWTCALLGVFSIALNVFVIQVLVFNRRKTFKNVFYLLVLHCSLVDWFHALALVAWCVPPLNLFSFNTTILLRKWPPIFLRTLNMVTISNLLLFTFNEYIVVSRPIFYRSHDLRRMFGLLLMLSWFACIFFGGGGLMYRYFESQPKFNVYVLSKKDDKNVTYLIPKKRPLNSGNILAVDGNGDDLLQRTFLLIALVNQTQ